jgi:HD superfamily phosphodiesterase
MYNIPPIHANICNLFFLKTKREFSMASVPLITIAHVCSSPYEKNGWKIHPLVDHLQKVGKLAAKFAEEFGTPDWAEIAGLWHDLGKYSTGFQRYIRNKSGYEVEAHIEYHPSFGVGAD